MDSVAIFLKLALFMNKIPTITIQNIFHVGLLDNEKKTYHEGSGLSVTNAPYSWIEICLFLNPKIYQYDESVIFADFISIINDNSLMNEIISWALKNNFIIEKNIYEIEYFDTTFDMTLSKSFESIDSLYLNGYQKKHISNIYKYKSTKKLDKFCNNNNQTPAGLVKDFIILTYLEFKTNLIGCWWNHEDEPQKFIAPRGVIFKKNLNIDKFKNIA